MGTCFVMQPFDGGAFDKRYESVFAPAIKAAGLEPYRVDRDPSVSVPIEDIKKGIRSAAICLADITTDNPNVWFELGFAMAIPREVILVCSDERKTRYPFDVQHLSILKYSTGAPQDFDEIKVKIEQRIQAIIKKNENIEHVANLPAIKNTEGLTQHELVALVTIMQSSFLSNGYVSGYSILKDMNKAGFTDIAVGIALKSLSLKKGMIESTIEEDGHGDQYTVYKPTSKGEQWIIGNQDKLKLTFDDRAPEADDVPF